jgi:hypothetical protein
MKKLVYVFLLLSFICCKANLKREQDKIMSIDFLDKVYFAEFYLLNNFIDNELCIKNLFDFANNKDGCLIFVTHKKGVLFDDGAFFLNDEYQNFFFENQDSLKSNNYNFIRLRGKTPYLLSFSIIEDTIKKKLSTDFDTLNLNIVQNMLDFAEADTSKFDTDNYTYELYNKDNIKKVVIKYHENGKWFEVEIL